MEEKIEIFPGVFISYDPDRYVLTQAFRSRPALFKQSIEIEINCEVGDPGEVNRATLPATILRSKGNIKWGKQE